MPYHTASAVYNLVADDIRVTVVQPPVARGSVQRRRVRGGVRVKARVRVGFRVNVRLTYPKP